MTLTGVPGGSSPSAWRSLYTELTCIPVTRLPPRSSGTRSGCRCPSARSTRSRESVRAAGSVELPGAEAVEDIVPSVAWPALRDAASVGSRPRTACAPQGDAEVQSRVARRRRYAACARGAAQDTLPPPVGVRALLDVNVIISGLLSRSGAPADVLRALDDGAFEAVASPTLLAELARVPAYSKLRRHIPERDAEAILHWFATTATIEPDPSQSPPARSQDADDDNLSG